MVKGYVRHDIFVQRIYGDLPQELEARYGKGLLSLGGGQDPHGGGQDPRAGDPGPTGPGSAGPDGSQAARRPAGVVPAGFAGRINLTIPLATLLGLAERPGEIRGIGPIDPDLGANTPDRYHTVTHDARSRCWLSITKITPCQSDPHG